MATPVNDRDVLIMGTTPRYTSATDQGLFLNPPAAVFKVSADGKTATPSSVTFQVTRLNIPGAANVTASDGVAPKVSGDQVTLNYSDFSAVSGTITATITVGGKAYGAVATVTKVADGASGSTTYTWVKYGDSAAGAGLSDDPTGKAYIGLAYNKSTATESTTASDYTWSLVKGTDGQPGGQGADGQTLYTWIKYSDYSDGTNPYDLPTSSTLYIGLAPNKNTPVESTVKSDYTWSKFKGDQGVPGGKGDQGIQGARGTVNLSAAVGSAAWDDNAANAAIAAAGYGVHQTRDVVTLYNIGAAFAQTRFWDGGSWQPVAQVVDGNLLVRGSVNAQALAVSSVKTTNLVVSGNPDNLIPDPSFYDLNWWGRLNQPTNNYPQGGTFWKYNRTMYFDHNTDPTDRNTYSTQIPMDPGATYLFEIQVYVSGDFSGALSAWMHIPNVQWNNFGVPLSGNTFSDGDPVMFWSGGAKGAQSYFTVYTVPAVVYPNNTAYYPTFTQVRIHTKIDAGYIEIGSIRMTRVNDAVLIKDGAVTANKLSVQQLDAVSARIGMLRTAASGNRVEISDNLIVGYRSNNTMAYKLTA